MALLYFFLNVIYTYELFGAIFPIFSNLFHSLLQIIP